MKTEKQITLEALRHCVGLDNPFAPVNCGEKCPLWKSCTGGTDLVVILKRLHKLIDEMKIPVDQTAKIFSGIMHCNTNFDLCNKACAYWKECRGEQMNLLFRDIYVLLTQYGAYDGE